MLEIESLILLKHNIQVRFYAASWVEDTAHTYNWTVDITGLQTYHQRIGEATAVIV